MKTNRLFTSLIFGLGLAAVLLVLLAGAEPSPAHATAAMGSAATASLSHLAATHAYTASPYVDIPPGGDVTSTITVPDSFLLGDLNVGINVRHRLRGDLVISLCNPSAVCLELLTNLGSSPAGLDVMFDDETSNYPTVDVSVPGGSNHDTDPPYYDYTWHPASGDLSFFDGQSVQGDWMLRVRDIGAPPPTYGRLNFWSLWFTEPAPRLDDSSLKVSTGPVLPGQTATYWITLLNTNYPTATASYITNALPSVLTLDSGSAVASSGVVTETGGGIEWRGQIGTQQTVRITYTAQVSTGAHGSTVINTAVLTDPALTASMLLTVPLTVAENFMLADDFELDDGGYIPGGSSSSWTWGAPTSGPGAAHSGDKVWATNLGGNYYYREDSYLTSPIIDLTGSGAPSPTLQIIWWQWLQTLSGVHDHAKLEACGGGITWTVLYGPARGDVDLKWTQRVVDISSFAHATDFQFRFHLDTLDYHHRRPGWYVDDVIVATISTTSTNDPPIADFTFVPTSPTTADTVQFSDTSTDPDGSIVGWAWDFGDGVTSTLQNPTHRFTETATYTVRLIVTDNWGTQGLTTQDVPVTYRQRVIHVATSGADAPGCGEEANPPCRTVQYAVDAAYVRDQIRVATGVYTDLHVRAGLTQVVYLSKTVTLRGGYSTTNWETSHPLTQPTTLDAQQLGRVMFITGTIAPTVDGFILTGGSQGYGGTGGGVQVQNASPVLSNNVIISNTASNHGGGLCLDHSHDAVLIGNTIQNNSAYRGGGLAVWLSENITLTGNVVQHNTGGVFGGGLDIWESSAMLSGNTIQSNTAENAGGMYVAYSTLTFNNNIVQGNTALWEYGDGGGLRFDLSTVTFNGNIVQHNVASRDGGGLDLYVTAATLSGNDILSNTAGRNGGGLLVLGASGTISGNVIQSNTAGSDGGGLKLSAVTGGMVSGNTIRNNIAGGNGGGVNLYSSGATSGAALSSNIVQSNTAHFGGGMYAKWNRSQFTGNEIISNTAQQGGGMYFTTGYNPSLVRNLVAGNRAAQFGGGIAVNDVDLALDGDRVINNLLSGTELTCTGAGIFFAAPSTKTLTALNLVVAQNQTVETAPTGGGLSVLSGTLVLKHGTFAFNANSGIGLHSGSAMAFITNTIVANHTTGITVTAGATATLWHTLWYNNETNTAGAGVVSSSGALTGDPLFVAPQGGDYHITSASAARNVGLDAEVYTDMDGDPRPLGLLPDIGADEFTFEEPPARIYLPLVMKNF